MPVKYRDNLESVYSVLGQPLDARSPHVHDKGACRYTELYSHLFEPAQA